MHTVTLLIDIKYLVQSCIICLNFHRSLSISCYIVFIMCSFRDWSLITGSGATKREGGMRSFTSTKRGGGAKQVLAMLNAGGSTSFGVVFTWELEVLARVKWGHEKCPLFKKGAKKSFTLS